MKRLFAAVLAYLVLCATVFPQDRGTIQCDPDLKQIMAWTGPGSAWVIDQLACGQEVSILGLEKGYYKIQLGNRIGYVYAKYVRLPQVQEQQTPKPEEPAKSATQAPQPPTPLPSQTDTQKAPKPPKADKDWPRRHEVGAYFDISHIYYAEPDFMRNKGMMWGVSGDYTYRPDNFMLKVDGRFSFGDLNYWSNGTGTMDGKRNYNIETRFAFGYDFSTASQGATFTPFVGLGYRYLFDGSEGKSSSTGATGYDRKSNYLYSPIGMETMFRLGRKWSLGLTGEYDLFWHGWQYSELGDYVVVTYPPIILPHFVAKNDQSDGWGARGSLKIVRGMGRVDFAVEPYFGYWNIADSDIIEIIQYPYSIYDSFWLREPANTTKEWGARFGIRF